MNPRFLRVGVIGGGLAGLAAAWRLRSRLPQAQVVVLEEAARLGGRIETDRRFGADQGAHYFLHSEAAIWRLIREVGVTGRVTPAEEDSQTFVIGRRRATGWLPDVLGGLFRDAPTTARALRRLIAEAERGGLDEAKVGPSWCSTWLQERFPHDRLARTFLHVLLQGELCAPPAHVTTHVVAGCLVALCSHDERWYTLQGGMVTLVHAVVRGLQRKGVRILTGWRAREVLPQTAGGTVVCGVRDAKATAYECDAVIVACPLDGRLRVARAVPRHCYHRYVSVLWRVSDGVDRVLRRALRGGGLYTDRPLNYVAGQGGQVYRVLLPSASIKTTPEVIAQCRAALASLAPELRRHITRLSPADWSVREWPIGLPCSRPSRGVRRLPGVFWAGDWLAEYPSIDGAVETGWQAAEQVYGFLSRDQNSSPRPAVTSRSRSRPAAFGNTSTTGSARM